jgi:nucleoside-diphosphate-sugar epimerase
MAAIKGLEKYNGLKILITGGAGFIGSHLVEKLLELNAEVTVIDNYLNGNKLQHLAPNENLTVHQNDITRYNDIAPFFSGKDLIFHLAAVVGVEETQSVPVDVLDVEIQGTINILNLAVKNKIKRVIFASSSEVYGDSNKPMREDVDLRPRSTYAVSKLVAEEYCKAFYKKHQLEFTALRYFNSYGPRQDKRFVISRFIAQCFKQEPIIIYGSGNQTRDFTYIDDSINMTLIAGLKKETKCEALNIGTGVKVSIKQLANLTKKLIGKNSQKPIYVNYGGYRPLEIEVFNRMADTHKAERLLNYKPRVTLETGIKNCIDWYLEMQNSR